MEDSPIDSWEIEQFAIENGHLWLILPIKNGDFPLYLPSISNSLSEPWVPPFHRGQALALFDTCRSSQYVSWRCR
jgi:hypothetical protein